MGLGLYVGNVGQGQCVTFIVGTGTKVCAAIVDVGGDGTWLARWLREMQIRFIATIVLTHNDEDHTQGLTAVVEEFAGRIGTVYYVLDRPATEISHWLPLQDWRDQKKIHAFDLVCPKDTSDPTAGRRFSRTTSQDSSSIAFTRRSANSRRWRSMPRCAAGVQGAVSTTPLARSSVWFEIPRRSDHRAARRRPDVLGMEPSSRTEPRLKDRGSHRAPSRLGGGENANSGQRSWPTRPCQSTL